ncbi:MAG: DUF4164 domain-containing protein [Alphaproteobacteria bacterium]
MPIEGRGEQRPGVAMLSDAGGAPTGGAVAGGVLEKAQRRLRLAVEGFEASLANSDRAQSNATAMEQELQVLFEDRSRLTHELDLALANVAKLETVGAEVSHRLETVMGGIRTVLTKS